MIQSFLLDQNDFIAYIQPMLKKYLTTNIIFHLIILFTYTNSFAQEIDSQKLDLKNFTEEVYQKLSAAKLLSEVDFYNSVAFKIRRTLRMDEVGAKNGILEIVNNVRIETITLPKRNVGRFSSIDNSGKLRISFDPRTTWKTFAFVPKKGSDGSTLMFLDHYIDHLEHIVVNYAYEDYNAELSNDVNKTGFDYKGECTVYLLYDMIKKKNVEQNNDVIPTYKSRRQN